VHIDSGRTFDTYINALTKTSTFSPPADMQEKRTARSLHRDRRENGRK